MTEETPNTLIPVTQSENALKVMNSQDYFPRLKLCQGSAKEVNTGKVEKGGYYALIHSKDKIDDAGKDIEIIIASSRAKALRTGDKILQYFDPSCAEFKEVEAEASVKDSGCMYGPEFLIWLPGQQMFATLFLCNPTGRRASSQFQAALGMGAILSSVLIDNGDFQWFGSTCELSTTPISDVPDGDILASAVEKFNNEKPSAVTKAEPTEGRAR